MADELKDVVIDTVEDEASEPVSIDEYARARGWKPQEEWDGDGEWRDARTFLDFGLDKARDVSHDLKALRATTQSMAETHARLESAAVERARQEERERLDALHTQAVEDGDVETAKLAKDRLIETGKPLYIAPPGVDAWVAANPWFNTDPAAHAVAKATAERNAALPIADQLALAQTEVFKRFPEYAPAKEPAKVIDVSTPAAMAGATKRSKTFHDLPAEAQQAARALVQMGRLKDTDGYVRQFFNKEGTVE